MPRPAVCLNGEEMGEKQMLVCVGTCSGGKYQKATSTPQLSTRIRRGKPRSGRDTTPPRQTARAPTARTRNSIRRFSSLHFLHTTDVHMRGASSVLFEYCHLSPVCLACPSREWIWSCDHIQSSRHFASCDAGEVNASVSCGDILLLHLTAYGNLNMQARVETRVALITSPKMRPAIQS